MRGLDSKPPDSPMQRKDLLEAGGRAAYQGVAARCPACQKANVRFYCHVLSKNNRVGSFWVWCPSCRVADHARGQFDSTDFPDPLADLDEQTFGGLQQGNWFAHLDELWEENKLPHVITTSRQTK
jgi:hypothetical protein